MTPADRYVDDANRQAWEYRMVCAVLQRRAISSSVWHDVLGNDFLHMTPAELRHVANVLEASHDPRLIAALERDAKIEALEHVYDLMARTRDEDDVEDDAWDYLNSELARLRAAHPRSGGMEGV
jgi:hypothetical protein